MPASNVYVYAVRVYKDTLLTLIDSAILDAMRVLEKSCGINTVVTRPSLQELPLGTSDPKDFQKEFKMLVQILLGPIAPESWYVP
jgi:hypothetical protein